jgi:hypothetical protein
MSYLVKDVTNADTITITAAKKFTPSFSGDDDGDFACSAPLLPLSMLPLLILSLLFLLLSPMMPLLLLLLPNIKVK